MIEITTSGLFADIPRCVKNALHRPTRRDVVRPLFDGAWGPLVS